MRCTRRSRPDCYRRGGRGRATIDGAWMLLLQGVEAFELWTGRDAPVESMNAALRNHLESDEAAGFYGINTDSIALTPQHLRRVPRA